MPHCISIEHSSSAIQEQDALLRQLEYPEGPVLVSDTVNPVSWGAVMLADAMRWVLLGIWKDVSAMANLDKSALPAVRKSWFNAKADEASHSAQSSTVKELIICDVVRQTVSVSVSRK